MNTAAIKSTINCPVLHSVFENDEKHWFHSEYSSEYNVRHFHAEHYKPLLPFVKFDSELFNVLCDNKIHFEYHPSWGFSRFCMGWMQYKNPKLFGKIYTLVYESLKDFPVKAVIDNGKIEIKIRPKLINGNIEDEVNDSLKWAESVNVDFDSKKIIDLCDLENQIASAITEPLKFNGKIVTKGLMVRTSYKKEDAQEVFAAIKQRVIKELGDTLHMEISNKKDDGLWWLIITLPKYIIKAA